MEDDLLLELIEEEGKPQEPKSFFPIFPLALVNGANGIGTGFSTFLPNHNPIELIDWLLARINETELPTVLPWYRGFKGQIF